MTFLAQKLVWRSMLSKSKWLCCALVCLPLCGQARGTSEAGLVSLAWQVSFEFHDPKRISIVLPGDDHATVFWYMLYEVTNETGRDVAFYPSFRLVTDSLEVVEGGANISPRVYDVIAARHTKEFPFFAAPHKITGPLLQGKENARASAAVFRAFDSSASRFSIYVSGLSGEVARVFNPAGTTAKTGSTAKAGDGNDLAGSSFLLRRTLAITYDLPGDEQTRGLTSPVRRKREWVMR